MTEKWGEIQRKLDLVRVSGEFEYGVVLYIAIHCIYSLGPPKKKKIQRQNNEGFCH